MTTASESEVRSCIESVSLNVGSMRLKEALREASRLAPVESKDLQVRFYDTGERKSRETLSGSGGPSAPVTPLVSFAPRADVTLVCLPTLPSAEGASESCRHGGEPAEIGKGHLG